MTDWVDVTALIAGPVLAVVLSLWRENRTQKRTRKMEIMRQFATLRSHPGELGFNNAINLIPIEFGKSDAVMTALEAFNAAASKQAMTDELNDSLMAAMMMDLGFSKRASMQAARGRYVSQGLSTQKELNEKVARSLISLAETGRQNALASKVMAEHVTGKTLPPLP